MKIVNDYKYTDNDLQFTKNKNAFNKRLKPSLFSIAAEVFENMLRHQQTQKKKSARPIALWVWSLTLLSLYHVLESYSSTLSNSIHQHAP